MDFSCYGACRDDLSDYRYIYENLRSVREKLTAAAARGGNPVPALIAVTKSATPEEVRALLLFGVDAIAENRPQLFRERAELLDALVHRAELAGAEPPRTALHLIGNLQTNKIKYVIDRAAMIQSLDSERLAEELDRQAERRGITVRVLIEVNSGHEEQKGGVLPEDVPEFAASLRRFAHLSPIGLMTMGPDCDDPEGYRPYFRLVRELAMGLSEKGLLPASPVLSMGMSGSFEVAAEEGATHVRVGRTLFKRPQTNE